MQTIAAGIGLLLTALVGAQAASPPQWEVREAGHPLLGPIRFAFTATPIATPVGISRVASQVYVSCERDSNTIAIELANAQAPGDPRGLVPRTLPKLVCKRQSRQGTVQEELRAIWAFNELGDVLARGFQPQSLLACKSIGVVQQVELPKGWSQETARLVFDITPATPEVRSVLAQCGGETALRQASSRGGEAAWQRARTAASGRTNLRAAASTDADVVSHLPPNAPVLVRKGSGDWWRVKAAAGGPEGFVRKDRLVFR
jgi:hypothetical protein